MWAATYLVRKNWFLGFLIFPKKRNYENEKQYKHKKNLFEQINKNHKKVYYEDKVSKFQTDIKRNKDYYEKNSWEQKTVLMIVDTEITEKLLIAKNLNDFLAFVIPNSSKTFQNFPRN